ncbi:eukaryotic translation initiation factor 4 gamma 1-like [Zerene cesonia]|uniref:eukaryotic translation initiation factor 4 gamma 1-like n=1 Tax=Zerene cesonia TaxID=33412 RepID=UPI0018E578FA|nr:eukaryotic translation initiation factor 4 gamma 1-like [Zerene cesonia]
MVVSPLFWEWFNVWLIQFLKNLYHEIKMVALRGGNSSYSSVPHGCGYHGGQHATIEVSSSLQPALGVPHGPVGHLLPAHNHVTHMGHAPHAAHAPLAHANHMGHSGHAAHPDHVAQKSLGGGGGGGGGSHLKSMGLGHANHGQASTQSHNGHGGHSTHGSHAGHALHAGHGGHGGQLSHKAVQFMQPTPTGKPEPSSRHSNTSRCSQYRASQSMPIPGAGAECYHPAGAAPYMAGSGQNQAMRTQAAPQPSAPPPPEMSKNNMAGHNYVSPPNATPPARPQYPNFQYRPAAQHSTRPSTHARQQQPFIPGAGAGAGGPVMYHPTLLFQPTHMAIPQSYQPPRSTAPGYYPYMPFISYSTPTGHTSPYYYPNGQGVAGAGAGRASAPLVPPATAAPALPHQPTPHMPIPGIRQGPAKRTSHRLPIINPVTRQDIFTELYSSDSQYVSGESSERQTPQPQENSQSIVEEFNRMVSEAANQPTNCEIAAKSNFVPKSNEVPATTASPTQPQANAINSINNNIVKSDILNDNKNIGPEVEVETPIVSAISDSPVIVPKMTNVKHQKSSETQSIAVDSKTQKPKQKKPNVPQNETHKQSDVTQAQAAESAPEPQPQRVREPRERARADGPEPGGAAPAPDAPVAPAPAPAPALAPSAAPSAAPASAPAPAAAAPSGPAPNGPAAVVISSADSTPEPINLPTSQNSLVNVTETIQKGVTETPTLETEPEADVKADILENSETFPVSQTPTASQLLSSIEKVAKEQSALLESTEEEQSASQAQAKLTQSIVSAARNNPESKMKDINLNNTSPDPDTANGNMTEVAETVKDVNKNEKSIKNAKNNSKKNKNTSSESSAKEETYENGKDETDKVSNVEPEQLEKDEELSDKGEAPATPAFVPKHKYSDDQWSPMNPAGKKTYDIRLLMQIKDDPLCRNKPNAPLLESCNILRTMQLQDSVVSFNQISRPVNDSLFPNFLKNTNPNMRSTLPRDNKKEGRNAVPTGKGSMKLSSSSSASGGRNIFISLREEVKLNETKDAWKPSRLKKENLSKDELKTQELYKKFRGILNKLTPQKFDTLLEKVKSLEIDTQMRLEGVIDLVFEKAIDEPNFSEAYAAMCNKLSTLKVPAANSPDQCVNFRALIISKCQNQFITAKTDENVMKLEKEIAECTDSAKKKELALQLEEINRRVRMRSVGNVRFIGELYKLKMLTAKIMVFCMNHLIEKLEEEKLECLCKLLTTIGQQVESEVKEQLEAIFKMMQDIIADRKANKISSRVRFMIQDVIELRRRKWVAKNVIDSQPKMMDQIQKEAEQQQRHIELMNASPMGGGGGGGGGFRREEGGGRKRGEGRRQGGNNFNESPWKPTPRANFTVDTNKLKMTAQKNLSNIKLGPPNNVWNQGSSTKNTSASNSSISLNKNMYSMLEIVQADPTSVRANKDLTPGGYQHSKSIERSTFNSRGDFNAAGRSGSSGGGRSSSGSRTPTAAPPPEPAPAPAPAPAPVAQEPLPDSMKKRVKQVVDLCFMNPDDDEMVEEIKLLPPQHHAAIITEMIEVVLEKNAKEISQLSKSVLHVVSTGTISAENLLAGFADIFDAAPDLYIDVPMLYDYLAKFLAPQIEKKHITLEQVHRSCETIISANHGHLLLRAIFKELKESMGPTFTKTKWQESGLQFKQWMNEDQVAKWIEDNRLQYVEGGETTGGERIVTPDETQDKLLQLMNADESCDCLRGWVQDNIGLSSGEGWFLRALTTAAVTHALGGRAGPLAGERLGKYAPLVGEYAAGRLPREVACLLAVQRLVHRLEHPQGLTLDIFQYLHEQYIISVEGFIAWELSENEPEGKAVMLKALTSFFTNIREADIEDSCSEA